MPLNGKDEDHVTLSNTTENQTCTDRPAFQPIKDLKRYFSEDQQFENFESKFNEGYSPMITSTRIIKSSRLSRVKSQDRRKNWEGSERTPLRKRSSSWGNEPRIPIPYDPKSSSGGNGFYSSITMPINIQNKSFQNTNDEKNAGKTYSFGEPNSFGTSVVYGMINTAVVLPVIMSFGSIIYHDPFFRPYLPVLVKLTTISGIVHQIMFSSFSSLPFAVGQVQDAGLIFLSAIASSIVLYCKERGYDDESILATCTIGLSLSTAILGVALLIIGKLELVSAVQKLPTSVVGGYLAFIGFFCGQSGLSLMSGVAVGGFLEWYKFFEGRAFILTLPGVLGGLAIYFLGRHIKHAAVLPTTITAIVILFYSFLNFSGTTLEEARNEGWINKADAPPVW